LLSKFWKFPFEVALDMPTCYFVGKIMDVYLRDDHMVSIDKNPLLKSGEVVDREASGSDPPSPLLLCYTGCYYLPFGVVINA
jgi:hypothetical protein